MELLEYRFYGLSEKGKRQKNEDAVLTLRLDDDTCFFAVADGMGGVRGGEIASNLILKEIKEYLENILKDSAFSCNDLKKLMSELFNVAQEAVRQYVATYPELKGMGTTLAALLIHKHRYVWASIGDSRIYLIHSKNVVRYTRDHTLLEDSSHENFGGKNVHMPAQYMHALTRVIDGGSSKPDVFPADEPWLKVDNDSIWIICSDGLIIDKRQNYSQLLLKYAESIEDPKVLCQSLVDYALQNGSTDNISVIVIKAKESVYDHFAPTQKIHVQSAQKGSSGINLKKWLLMTLAFLITISLFSYLLWFYNLFGVSERYCLKKNQSHSARQVSRIIGYWYQNNAELSYYDCLISKSGNDLFRASSIQVQNPDTTFSLFTDLLSDNLEHDIEKNLSTSRNKGLVTRKIRHQEKINNELTVISVFESYSGPYVDSSQWINASGMYLVADFLCLIANGIADGKIMNEYSQLSKSLGLKLKSPGFFDAGNKLSVTREMPDDFLTRSIDNDLVSGKNHVWKKVQGSDIWFQRKLRFPASAKAL